jgi:hypothetical protein
VIPITCLYGLRINTDFFVRFVNLLLNDATYVLDESLTKFPKIHDLQMALANPSSLNEETRAAKEEELAQVENQAQSYMQLANETIAMMKLFTSALSESFTMPEIVQRLADMMDYNLDTLVGEIPYEFLDPLMYSLMEDPVILPMSKQTVDRSTIRSHLLSDPTDPFNRQPMSIEDVVPNVDLKEQIEVFKEKRKVIAKKAIQDRMDTAEG